MSDISPVTDPDDPRLAAFLGLRDHGGRQRRELPGGDMAAWFMGEGRLVIDRALAAGCALRAVLVDAKAADTDWLRGLAADVYLAGPEVLEAVSGRSRLKDPIGCFHRPQPTDPEALVDDCNTVVVLEGVANPTNLGMIIRNAAGLGIDGVLVDPYCCDPLYRRCVRVSMGQVFAVPHARVRDVADFLGALTDAGFETVALTPRSDATDLRTFERGSERLAILLGTEGVGLTDAVLASAGHQLRIPMASEVDSLNVAAASAVAFYALGAPAGP